MLNYLFCPCFCEFLNRIGFLAIRVLLIGFEKVIIFEIIINE